MADPNSKAPPLSADDAVRELVTARAEHSRDHYRAYFRRLARFYDLFRGLMAGNWQVYRNNIHIPFLFSVIESTVARMSASTFGSWPIVGFAGYAPEDAPVARKNEILISAQMKDCGSFPKAVDLFTTAALYGIGIARHGWRKTVRRERWREVDPATNAEFVREGDITRFNGPDWEVIDPLDFWPQPGKRRLHDMAWVVHRYYVDLDQIQMMAAQEIYRPSSVRALREASMSEGATAEMTERQALYRSRTEYEALKSERYARPVEIWEMWGDFPLDLAPDGIVRRVVTLANRRVILRNEPLPYWHGEIPFIACCPQPDPHYFHGVGKGEIMEKMQFTANRLANQKLDALDLFVDPVFLMNRTSGIDTQSLYMRAGRVIGVDGPVDDTTIRPLSPDLRGLQAAYAEIGQLWQWMQQGTGIVEDTVQGLPSSGRQTAREYLGRQEQVMGRLMMEAHLAEEEFVEKLANSFRALDRQYLEVPHEVRILGSVAAFNPITGLPMPPEPVVVDLGDLNADYRARAVGATQMLGKSVRQQNLIAVMQAFSANPALVGTMNWPAFGREILETFDFTNPDELLITGQMPLLNQLAMQSMGGAPGGAGGVPGLPAQGGVEAPGAMANLSPGVLGAQPAVPLAGLTGG